MGRPHEAMVAAVGVPVRAGYSAFKVDASGVRSPSHLLCSRSVDGRESAVGRTDESVVHIVRVGETSRNCPERIDCTPTSGRAGSRSIERGDVAIWLAHKAVTKTIRIRITSGYRACGSPK